MPKYRRIFLDGYSYYITMVTYERNPILIDNMELLRMAFSYAKSKFDFRIDEIVILPDHLHMIITPDRSEEYPKIVSTIKRYFSKHCPLHYYAHLLQSHSRDKERYFPVWQKKFYEHTIRDEKDYYQKREYIHTNPIKHGYAKNIFQWKYGSLHRRFGRAERADNI